MAGHGKDASLALIAARDPTIRALLDQGYEVGTNAVKTGAVPPGIKAKTDQGHVRSPQ